MFHIIPRSLFVKLGWTTLSYGIVQALRLVSNVVLSRLLAPPLFGIMLIVNTVRIGVELLSDVGIGQNVVRNPRGEEPVFYDTAWTVQAIRGLVLGTGFFLGSGAIARFFEKPELAQVLPIAALFFIFTGLDSTGRFLAQKRLNVGRSSIVEVFSAAASLVIYVILALITPTIWALILGTVFAGALTLILSFTLTPGIRHRFVIDRPSLREMLLFGRWVFVSSIVYFAAMNFDRLYFAKQITLTQLGIFGIARTLADTINQLVSRCSAMILFPLVSAMRGSGAEIRAKLIRGRRLLLIGAAVGLGLFTALSDVIVNLLYDPRYTQAGVMLPLLTVGVWFALLAGVNDTIVVGMGHPKLAAMGNVAKLLTFIVGVPLALGWRGLDAALIMLSAGEFVRYLVLWLMARREGVGFARDDLALTLLFVAATVGFRMLLAGFGLTTSLGGLFAAVPALFNR